LLTVDDDDRVSSLCLRLLTVKGLGTWRRDGAIVPKNVFPSCVVSGSGSSTFIAGPHGAIAANRFITTSQKKKRKNERQKENT
jgi:hypothetical protein